MNHIPTITSRAKSGQPQNLVQVRSQGSARLLARIQDDWQMATINGRYEPRGWNADTINLMTLTPSGISGVPPPPPVSRINLAPTGVSGAPDIKGPIGTNFRSWCHRPFVTLMSKWCDIQYTIFVIFWNSLIFLVTVSCNEPFHSHVCFYSCTF